MTETRTYPQGVSCWIDTEQGDPDAAAEFYGGLFGWTFENAMPPDAPGVYLIAQLDGSDVAAIGSAATESSAPAAWNTYIAVDDVDAFTPEVVRAGGVVLSGPEDAGPGGRMATCRDSQGAEFRLWQAAGSARRWSTSRAPGTSATSAPATSPPRRPSTNASSTGTT